MLKNSLLFSDLTFRYNQNVREKATPPAGQPVEPLFYNLVECIKDLQSICALLVASLLLVAIAGCNVNRVTLRSTIHNVPLEIELISNGSGNRVPADSSNQSIFGSN